METKKLFWLIAKHTVYALLLLLLFFLQEAPAFTLFGARAIPVIGLFIAVSMLENEFAGGLYGLAAGLLCDSASIQIFGVASMLFLVMGCAAGLLSMYLVNARPRSAVLLTAAAAAVYGLVCHYILYGVWGYAGAARLLLTHTLPTVLLTAAWGFALFFLVRSIRDAVQARIGG